MADLRNFAKIDLGYFENPKTGSFLEDDPRVLILHLRAILYCRAHLTDGTFPIRQVVRLACASYCGSQCEGECDVCKATQCGLLRRVDSRTALVHDYLEHQDSAEQAERRTAAGRKAAEARWSTDANRNADGNAEKRRDEKSIGGRKRAPETALPDDWKPNTGHQDFANAHGLDMSTEAFRFRNHAHANDRRQRNWDAAFRTWLSKAKDYAPPKAAANRNHLPEAWR